MTSAVGRHEKPWCLFPCVPWKKMGLAGQISCVLGKNMSSRSKYLLFANLPLLPLHSCTIIASEGRDAADLTAVTLNLSDIVYCRAMQNIVHQCIALSHTASVALCNAVPRKQSPCDIVQSMLCSATHSFCCNLHCSVTEISCRSHR